jgi:hypothetical protein
MTCAMTLKKFVYGMWDENDSTINLKTLHDLEDIINTQNYLQQISQQSIFNGK